MKYPETVDALLIYKLRMSKNKQKDRREKQALLKACNIKITCISQPEYQKTECSIC